MSPTQRNAGGPVVSAAKQGRPRNRFRIAVALLCVFAVLFFVAVGLPASIVQSALQERFPAYRFTASEGSVWDGRLLVSSVGGHPLGVLGWSLDTASLVQFRPALKLSVRRGLFDIDGRLAPFGEQVSVFDLQARLDLGRLPNQFAGIFSMSGDLTFSDVAVSWPRDTNPAVDLSVLQLRQGSWHYSGGEASWTLFGQRVAQRLQATGGSLRPYQDGVGVFGQTAAGERVMLHLQPDGASNMLLSAYCSLLHTILAAWPCTHPDAIIWRQEIALQERDSP